MSETTLPPPPSWTPVTAGTPVTPAPPAPPAPPTPKAPFHARVVRIWWAIGVALACLVVGAGTGSLITHLTERHGNPTRFQQFPGGFGQNGFGVPGQGFRFRGPGGQFNAPNGQTLPNGQGQLPGQGAPNVVPPDGSTS